MEENLMQLRQVWKTVIMSVAGSIAVGMFAMTSVTASEDAKADMRGVYFPALHDRMVVSNMLDVQMGVRGMTIHQAGEIIDGTGHFHLIIDGHDVDRGEVVKKDATHLHFGKGQMETTLELTPGEHTLTLQLADGHHISYGKDWSKTIHVDVKP